MNHFVYITTNLINGKQYIGDHSSNFLKDCYLGSGKAMKLAIKKYGAENFKREIIEIFETKQEAFDAQEKYILMFNTISPNGYNLSPTGGTEMGGILSEESKKKISDTLSRIQKGKPLSEYHKSQLSKNRIGLHPSDEARKKMSESAKKREPTFKGKKHTVESRMKISQAGKGRRHSEETKERFKKRIPWNKGRIDLPKGKESTRFLDLSPLKDNIVDMHINKNLSAKRIGVILGISNYKIIQFLKENKIYKRKYSHES